MNLLLNGMTWIGIAIVKNPKVEYTIASVVLITFGIGLNIVLCFFQDTKWYFDHIMNFRDLKKYAELMKTSLP